MMRTPYRLKKYANAIRRLVYPLRNAPRPCPVAFDGGLGSTKALFLALSGDLHRKCWDENGGRFRIGRSFQRSLGGSRADALELGARSFIGAAYFLRSWEKDDLRERYLEFVRKGTDPASAAFWGRIDSGAVLVENASLVIGFLLDPKLWERLGAQERKNFRDYIASCAGRYFHDSNWLWFKIFHLLFLELTGGPGPGKDIPELLERLGSFYDGEGWYSGRMSGATTITARGRCIITGSFFAGLRRGCTTDKSAR
jgi:hypothetical protein